METVENKWKQWKLFPEVALGPEIRICDCSGKLDTQMPQRGDGQMVRSDNQTI